MQTKLKGLLEKIKGFFKKLNKKTLIILAVCATVILALIIGAALMLNRKEYALLYTGLNASETTGVHHCGEVPQRAPGGLPGERR